VDIYVATTNPGKLRDFRHAVEYPQPGTQPLNLQPLPNLSTIPAPIEDGDTFEANARLKAMHYSHHAPDAWVLADDSGLEVDALQGRPGVRSARFAQDVGVIDVGINDVRINDVGIKDVSVNVLGTLDPAQVTDTSNNQALLLAMLEQTNRAARYCCALALARNGTVHHVSFGTLKGEILNDPEGTGGFGYDPLFFLPELGLTMAQISPAQRLHYSHRGQALRALQQQLTGTSA